MAYDPFIIVAGQSGQVVVVLVITIPRECFYRPCHQHHQAEPNEKAQNKPEAIAGLGGGGLHGHSLVTGKPGPLAQDGPGSALALARRVICSWCRYSQIRFHQENILFLSRGNKVMY